MRNTSLECITNKGHMITHRKSVTLSVNINNCKIKYVNDLSKLSFHWLINEFNRRTAYIAII